MPNQSVTTEIAKKLKYGSADDKLEAITLARRKVDELFLTCCFDQETANKIKIRVRKVEPFSDSELKEIKSALLELLASGKDVLACWYAAVTLVDIDHLSDSLMEALWTAGNQLMTWLAQKGEKEPSSLTYAAVALPVIEDTIRALSSFKDFPAAGEKIKECLEGKALLGRQERQEYLRQNALYAFGAIGNEEYRDIIEYWAEYGKGDEKKAAKAALELWGKGSYDDIKKLAGAKSKGGPCFIATAVYGDSNAPVVRLLKKYRDFYLSDFRIGRWLINRYYNISPNVVNILKKSRILMQITRNIVVNPVAKIIEITFHEQKEA